MPPAKKTAVAAPAKKEAAKPAKKNGDAKKKDNPCVPFFVKVAVLTPDDQNEIHFGISKICNSDNSVTWSISFVLKQLSGGQMTTRVEIEAQVGPENAAAMEKLAATKKLTQDQVDTLQGPVADLVKELPPGSKGTPETKAAVVEAVTS
jgi:hypothetical protein